MTEITEKELDDIMDMGEELDTPVIVDFYADWCGPCKTMSPMLEGIAEEYEGKLTLYKMDIEKNQQVVEAFGITSVPSFLIINGGRWHVFSGAFPKPVFMNKITGILGVEI